MIDLTKSYSYAHMYMHMKYREHRNVPASADEGENRLLVSNFYASEETISKTHF